MVREKEREREEWGRANNQKLKASELRMWKWENEGRRANERRKTKDGKWGDGERRKHEE